MGSDAHPDVDELFATGPEEFVARRQALVKQLRASGDRERAAEVAGLRRPTVAAWAVNQLARRHPDELSHLLDVGHELEEAHEGLLSGARPDGAVTAGRRRREAVAALTDLAVGLLTESGRGADAHRDAIAGTLDAASLDPQSGAVVQAGRLSRELVPPSGFGLDWVAEDWSPPPRPARTAPPKADVGDPSPPIEDPADDDPVEDPADGRSAQAAEVEADARRAAQAAEAAAAAAAAGEEATRAAQAAVDAEDEVEQLERALDEAKTSARAARRAAADAAAQARKAAAAAQAATGGAGRSG